MQDVLNGPDISDAMREGDMTRALQTIAHGKRPGGGALSGEAGKALARAVLVKWGEDWTPNGERVRGMLAND